MEIENEKEILKKIKAIVCETIDIKKDIDDEEIKDVITDVVFNFSKGNYLNIEEKRKIIDSVFNSMRRLDVLQPIIDDRSITEIMINGPDDIFVERCGRTTKSKLHFESREKLEDVIQSIVSNVNRIVNEASPIVDARLKDGSRVNVVLSPVALNGPVMTIRKFPEKPMTMEQLIEIGSITKEAAGILGLMVEAKYNIFISGGTGSGKTTFMNALSNFIPKDERIITIEDSAELQIKNIENIVRMETRNANTEGKGKITVRELIKSSLRMRPERIIVGEVRGPEALDMLQAMNTGHDGSLSTGHANSTKDILKRLETMVLGAVNMPIEAIRQQIASSIDIVIHISRIRDKSRRVVEISEVIGIIDKEIVLNPLYMFEEDLIKSGEENETSSDKNINNETIDSNLWVSGNLRRTNNKMVNTHKFKMAGIRCDLAEV
ncbi:MAG: CpaF family protein [Clostridia bacterium]|jgi:pilus assembly protein CpaF